MHPTPEHIEQTLEQVLLSIQKPGRYVGGEFNSVRKDWDQVTLRAAMAFPDLYDLGMSNLGWMILYGLLNDQPDMFADRVFSPWTDMEALMRTEGIPLYSLESKRPLAEFDLIGFSLPYETLFTNTLNILDLAGIPVRTEDRRETDPIIIAGGHSTMNPEPMHAFIDAFVVGEGEQIIHEILEAVKLRKEQKTTRRQVLLALAHIPGIYVPSLYKTHYLEDGTVSHMEMLAEGLSNPVLKRIVPKLPPPPTKFIVPNIEVVHNRASVEITRGCTRGCRFCHAGMITRPVRERSVAEVVAAAREAIRSTGFEELALLSLSSSDYTHISELVSAIGDEFKDKKLTVSLPSLRIESVSIDLMDKLRDRRSSGFTLAPEAATERMRRIINKFIPEEDILNTTREIYRRGWTTIKLYFMIGHPSETLEDVQAIADLCKRILAEGRKVAGMKVKLHAGVSTFVPKPQTPFQWVSCDTRENILAKQDLLRRELRDRNIKLSWTAPEDSLLEAWLSRGDRKLSEVIFSAWKNGAKFDAWNEHRRYETWMTAFAGQGLNPDFYTYRQRRTDEIFAWDHITAGVRKSYLFQDFRQSLEGQIRVDCRLNCYACGILPTFSNLRRENPGEVWKCPEVKSPRKTSEPAVTSGNQPGSVREKYSLIGD
jgi:radical SAM family uncharacterized protein